ncbi:ABC transporter ATPase [Methylobacterium radiodurans]|uniref:ABC transporter ATPase n=1 Tax=Methylobacterium radiodurans TaxID=2202828 RepID=A0A2U8VZU0_9HYPH|nr:ABC transporter ATPase [Methylobacterium radiodurans]AWN38576.1 ABC transporter ATPase [Methylobacterium radiodurans]
MRAITFGLVLLVAGPASADECGDLIGRVAAETGAKLDDRSRDYARFTADAETSLTLSCAAPHPSSVGAQYRGANPPEAYYTLFGQAGHAVTGVAAGTVAAAAHRAREAASRLRHSNVEAGGATITCSVTRKDTGDLTLCAVIETSDRS